MSVKKLQPSFDTVLQDLITWFEKSEVKAVIIGGIAVSLLGKPRTTQDIDALILLEQDEWAKFFNLGKQFGFQARISNALQFAKKNRVLLMQHSSGIDLDLSFGALPFEEESVSRRKFVKLGKLKLPLPTPEDLIIMKAVAHRPKDLIDIEMILAAHPKLDKKRIKKWVHEFAEVLENPEIDKDLTLLLKK